jgi:muconate cycloisomerase
MDAPADLNGPQFLRSTYLKQDWRPVVDGRAAVPAGAGLGVDVDEDAVRELAGAE